MYHSMKAKPESLLLIKRSITGIDPNLGAVCEWHGALESPPPPVASKARYHPPCLGQDAGGI